MANNAERIVRPFETGDVFTAPVLAPVQPAVVPQADDPVMIWGGTEPSEYLAAPNPAFMGYKTDWEEDASRRKTSKVRVTNPTDSNQFVDVERIDAAVFKNKKSGEEMNLKMNWGAT